MSETSSAYRPRIDQVDGSRIPGPFECPCLFQGALHFGKDSQTALKRWSGWNILPQTHFAKKKTSLNNRFLRTWLHQLFTHATRISSKQSRPPSQPVQRTLKTEGKFVRTRAEKSSRGVVSNCAACVSNDVKEDPPISGRECHRRGRRPRQSNATAQGNTKGANGRGSCAVTATVCVWLARAPMCPLSRCFRWVMVPFTTLPRLSCSPSFPCFNEVEGQWVLDGAGDAELFHKSVKGCCGSSLSTTQTVRPSQ